MEGSSLERKLEVVYIGGYGRSGSSLLDGLIAERYGAVSGGELTHLFQWAVEGGECSCGLMVRECELWGPVLEDVMRLRRRSLSEMAQTTRGVEMEGRSSERPLWQGDWQSVYEALYRRHGVSRVVDSSKTAGGRRRATLQSGLGGVDTVLFVHLWRDLKEVVSSTRKGNNRLLELGLQGKQGGSATLRTFGAWLRANRDASSIARYSAGRTLGVSYNAVVEQTDCVLEIIGQMAAWQKRSRPDWNHAIAGNRFRRGGWAGEVRRRPTDTSLPHRLGVGAACVQRLGRLAGWVPQDGNFGR